MEFIKHSFIILIIATLSGCANVNYYLGSAAKLDKNTTFDSEEFYSYYDDKVSGRFTFDDFEISVIAYNTITTERNFELLFVSVDKQGPFKGDVGKSPFLVEIRLRGEKNSIEFYPFQTKLNDSIMVTEAKFKDPKPECEYQYTEWEVIDSKKPHLVPDKKRNETFKCVKQGWFEYLLAFDIETPHPQTDFSVTLALRNIKTNNWINKTIYFSAAQFISTQTH